MKSLVILLLVGSLLVIAFDAQAQDDGVELAVTDNGVWSAMVPAGWIIEAGGDGMLNIYSSQTTRNIYRANQLNKLEPGMIAMFVMPIPKASLDENFGPDATLADYLQVPADPQLCDENDECTDIEILDQIVYGPELITRHGKELGYAHMLDMKLGYRMEYGMVTLELAPGILALTTFGMRDRAFAGMEEALLEIVVSVSYAPPLEERYYSETKGIEVPYLSGWLVSEQESEIRFGSFDPGDLDLESKPLARDEFIISVIPVESVNVRDAAMMVVQTVFESGDVKLEPVELTVENREIMLIEVSFPENTPNEGGLVATTLNDTTYTVVFIAANWHGPSVQWMAIRTLLGIEAINE